MSLIKHYLGLMVLSLMIALSLMASGHSQTTSNFRNILIGGDFGTNPWQRGTSQNNIGTTPIYLADRWFLYGSAGASSALTYQREAISNLTGFTYSARAQRQSTNSNTARVNIAQEIESINIIPAQGQMMALSWYALADANFSALSSQMEVIVTCGTGTDQGSASYAAGTWTGQTNVVDQFQAITTSWARYSLIFTMPLTCTEAVVQFSFTPTGSAGTVDGFEFTGAQLEIIPAIAVPAQGQPTAFERRLVQEELLLSYRYYWQLNEGTVAGAAICPGLALTVSTVRITCPLPQAQRTTVGSVVSNAGAMVLALPAGAYTSVVTGFSAGACSGQTMSATVTTAATTLTAGNASLLVGESSTGYVGCNAEL